jgi:alanine racemase
VQAEAHGARLTIDLGAIVANWRACAARAGVACAGVVKADAYGCGIEQVAPALAAAGCKMFFVAHLSEASRLRAVAPDATIYVLNGLPPGAAPLYAAQRLRPALGSGAEVAEWLAAFPGLAAPAALHVDSGMNRLGLRPEEIGDLPSVFRPALLMSHFVASEIPSDPANARQIAAFAAACARFPDAPASLANSSGVFLEAMRGLPQAVVRPGYALYGGNPTPHEPNPMREVVRLAAAIVQVRHVPAGETVGYNATWTAPADRRIATVSLGYADGYLRSAMATAAKPAAHALVNGRRAPLVGRVSMDLITLDVTDCGRVGRGDPAVFLGGELSVDAVGALLGTNGYEVLTSLGRRHARAYLPAR